MGGIRTLTFDNCARKLTAKISAILELDHSKQEVVSYGLTVLLNNFVGLLGILVIAYFLGALVPTAGLTAALLLLRPSAGGAHSRSSFNCSLFGYLFMPLLGFGARLLAEQPVVAHFIYIGISFMLALWGIFKNAPYFTQEKPRALVRQQRLKNRAIFLASVVFSTAALLYYLDYPLWSLGLATGLLMQGSMLLPFGICFVERMDSYIDSFFKRTGGEPE